MAPRSPADVLLTGAVVHTLDPRLRRASALAIRDGRILAVGNERALADLAGAATVRRDLRGRCLVPGLHDAHLHFLWFGLGLTQVDLHETPSLEAALARVRAWAEAHPQAPWVVGRGWQQELWPGAAFPTAADLDRVVPDRPVLLSHRSGHAAWLNQRALDLAGLGPATPDPPGGALARHPDGAPSGVLFENAVDLAWRVVPAPTPAERRAALLAAQRQAHAVGLTAVGCFDGHDAFTTYQELHREGELRLRVTSHVSLAQFDGAVGCGLRSGYGDAVLRTGCLKLFADGALGSRTAWMLEPYEGDPGNLGVCTLDPAELTELARRASRAGLSVAVHAIGDRAVRTVLDAFAAVRADEAAAGIPPNARRHRVEHVQVLSEEDLPRLAELQVIASLQPIHATADMLMADRWWGPRSARAYACASLAAHGTRLAFGSDAPVEDINPFAGLHAAVTRRRADGAPGPAGWYPEQRVDLRTALSAYTHGAAWAEGREHEFGTLAPGQAADLLVLDHDPFGLEPEQLRELQPRGTVVAGELVFGTWGAG